MTAATNAEALAQSGRWEEFVAECEQLEIAAAAAGERFGLYAAELMGLLLCCDDAVSAKHLWKRVPRAARDGDADLAEAWAVARELLRDDRAAAQRRLSAAQGRWRSPLVVRTAAALGDALRSRTLALLARAFAAISVAEFAAALGLRDDVGAALAAAQAAGWQLLSGDVLRRPALMQAPREASAVGGIAALCDFAVHLDTAQ